VNYVGKGPESSKIGGGGGEKDTEKKNRVEKKKGGMSFRFSVSLARCKKLENGK